MQFAECKTISFKGTPNHELDKEKEDFGEAKIIHPDKVASMSKVSASLVGLLRMKGAHVQFRIRRPMAASLGEIWQGKDIDTAVIRVDDCLNLGSPDSGWYSTMATATGSSSMRVEMQVVVDSDPEQISSPALTYLMEWYKYEDLERRDRIERIPDVDFSNSEDRR